MDIKKRIEVLNDGFVELVDRMGDDYSIIRSARVSTGATLKKGDEKDKGLIRYMYKNNHMTPFEQVVFTFHLKLPLFVNQQLLRHRTFCLAGDTQIQFDLPSDIKKGKYRRMSMSIKEFYRKWNENDFLKERLSKMNIRALNESTGEIIHSNVKNVFYNGKEVVNKYTFGNNYSIVCTENHKVLTLSGWMKIEDAYQHNIPVSVIARMQDKEIINSQTSYIEINEDKEAWKIIPNYSKYEVSNFGRVRSFNTTSNKNNKERSEEFKILKQPIANTGYPVVNISSDQKQRRVCPIHHLVYRVFNNQTIEEGNAKKEIRHLDGNKLNNKLENLSEDLYVENVNDRVKFKELPYLIRVFYGFQKKEIIGIDDVYDLEMDSEYPNFIINEGIVVHNSFNQESARYKEIKDSDFFPENWRIQDTKNKQNSFNDKDLNNHKPIIDGMVKGLYERSNLIYKELLKRGVAREQARTVMPVGQYTEIYFTVDLRNLLHFLDLRNHEHAQYEIRVYAQAIKEILESIEGLKWTMGIYNEINYLENLFSQALNKYKNFDALKDYLEKFINVEV